MAWAILPCKWSRTKMRNAEQIAEFFDLIGGDLETGCGNNSWYWKITCLKSDFEKRWRFTATS